VSAANRRSGFDFHNNNMLDEKVDTERILKPHSLEVERNRSLPFHREILSGKITGQHAFVYVLTQAGAELAPNTKRSTNNDPGNGIQILHEAQDSNGIGQKMSAKSAKSAKSAAFKNWLPKVGGSIAI